MRCAYTTISLSLTIRRVVNIRRHPDPPLARGNVDLEKILRQGGTLIHPSPEVIEASVDLEEYFINVPPVAGMRRLAQAVGVRDERTADKNQQGLYRKRAC